MKWLIGIIAYTLGLTSTPPASFSAPAIPSTRIEEVSTATTKTEGDPLVLVTPNGSPITLEWATSSLISELGLSGRSEIPENEGMIFDFLDAEDGSGIWMEGMLFSIDILWLSDRYEVVGIEKKVSPKSYPFVYEPPKGARYALEVSEGFAQKENLKKGDKLTF